MQIFEQIRTRIHNRILRKELPLRKVRRSSMFIENANTVGILFDASQLEQRQIVLDFKKHLREEGKKVKLLAYVDSSLKGEYLPFDSFSRKDLDWVLRPKSNIARDFIDFPFDLLLNFSQKPVVPLEYIAAKSKARFRVGGLSAKTFCYDMMIDVSKQGGLKSFINLVVFYLQKMQPAKADPPPAAPVAAGVPTLA